MTSQTKVNSEPELLLFSIMYCKHSKLYRIKIITDFLFLSNGLVLQQKSRWTPPIYIIVAMTAASTLNQTYVKKFNVCSPVYDEKYAYIYIFFYKN